MMRGIAYLAGLTVVLAVPGAGALAAPLTLAYDAYVENKVLFDPFNAGATIRLDGSLPDRGGGGISENFAFTAGSADVSLSAGWRTLPAQVRTVGVNIDLLDASNTVIASDTFQGTANGLARSQLSFSGLTPGAQYTLQFTGTAAGQGGRFQVDLVSGAVAPATPPTPVAAISPAKSLFDTLVGDKTFGTFAPGDTLLIDGVLTESGGITDTASLTVTGDTLSAGIVWLVAPGPQQTVGVNVDLLDAFNAVVATDTFMGVTGGQAFSQLVFAGLAPGDYSLVFTGTAQQGGRYRIDLTTDPTAPGFKPIPVGDPPTGVPEPISLALLLTGLAGLAGARRSGAAGRPDRQVSG